MGVVADTGSRLSGFGFAHPGIDRSGRVDQTDPAPAPSRRRGRSGRLGPGPDERRGDAGTSGPVVPPGPPGSHSECGQSR
eukprot:3622184-Alexandrium_andersonii.AAC.1